MRFAWLGSALTLTGCVPLPVPLPNPTPVRPEQAGSALAPLERLGRFDGEGFIDVGPESVPPSHLYVLVHGWAPGWGRLAQIDPRVRAWEATDEQGNAFEPWMVSMAHAIHRADPHAVVLVYSWIDDAATGRYPMAHRRAFAHTELHGRWLADALMQALDPDFIPAAGRMHLIGHSYGARVAALGALVLPKRPQHLTLFDSPDAPLTHFFGSQTMLAGILRKLPIGSGPGYTFVDNYVSMVGAHYHDDPKLGAVIDVVLAPPYGAMDYRHRHLYPMEFYTETAERDFGLGWSPLIADHAPAEGCYRQTYGELALERGCDGLP